MALWISTQMSKMTLRFLIVVLEAKLMPSGVTGSLDIESLKCVEPKILT